MSETFEIGVGPRCPDCGHLHQPDEPSYFDESTDELECFSCGATFDVYVHVTTSWRCTSRLPSPDKDTAP